ncbi:MAG: DoxX family protein [Candidatus Woykebacteria bacterium]
MTYSAKVSLFLLRLGIGWVFFYAGWSKVITFFTDTKNWTAAGFLIGGAKDPTHIFAPLFESLAGNTTIDYLNAYGLLFIGIGLLSGGMVRLASLFGIILMLLYYLPGYPPENAFIIDDHIIYSLVLIFLAAAGAGRMWGLDKNIEKWPMVKKNPWLVKILG